MKVALDFDVVLVWAAGEEEVVVVLDPLEFVGDDDGAAELAVFEGAGVAASWMEGNVSVFSFFPFYLFGIRGTVRRGILTFHVRNEHISALVHGTHELLLKIREAPADLSDIAPWLPLHGIHEHSP